MKRAYHNIILPNGTFLQGPVVIETDADGHFLNWHKLEGEEPFTEWIGGSHRLTEESTYSLNMD